MMDWLAIALLVIAAAIVAIDELRRIAEEAERE